MAHFTSRSAHEFIPPGPADSRSPCPALNALANQSYLSHDGRNLSALDLIRALRQEYHISIPLATMLSVAGVMMCGNGWKLNLEGLAMHNRIEHDASLTHDDAAFGAAYAPTAVDSKLLQALLQQSSDARGLTFQDLIKARAARDASLKKPLDGFHNAIAQGEVALTFGLFKDGDGEVPKESIRQWFGQQKFPDGWIRPSQTIGLWNTIMTSRKVGTSVKEINKAVSKKLG